MCAKRDIARGTSLHGMKKIIPWDDVGACNDVFRQCMKRFKIITWDLFKIVVTWDDFAFNTWNETKSLHGMTKIVPLKIQNHYMG